jgi:hypothetical protein
MKKVLLVIFALGIAAVAQQATNPITWVYGYVGNKAQWFKLDMASFLVAPDGTLSVKAPSAQVRQRAIGSKLAYDAPVGGWRIMATTVNLEIWVNGLHYWQDIDYSVTQEPGGVLIKPLGTNMLPEFDVRASWEMP